MLVSFSVANFRSIGEEQTLNLVASNKISDHPNHVVSLPGTTERVLRTALMYGANAAGKSNIVRAMAFAQRTMRADERRVTPCEPFRFDPLLASRPTSFEFRFLAAGHIFAYGFDLKAETIEAEWLSVLDDGEDRVIFERDRDGRANISDRTNLDRMFSNDNEIASTLNALASLPLTRHQLLLNRANSLPEDAQGATLGAVIRWLTRDLLILLPDHRSSSILDRLLDDPEFRGLAEKFLDKVGTGVRGLDVATEEIDVEQSGLAANRWLFPLRNQERLEDMRPKPDDPDRLVSRRLLAKHSVGEFSAMLPFSEESDGTKQLLHFMPVLSSVTADARIVVIDELDRSLHPLLCWEFIRIFCETAAGVRKQLIVTTHEAHLLNQDLLRRDEYWFVEKDGNQQTRLVSLSDFQVRNDLQLEKGYLHGRFGGVPVIGSMAEVEKLLRPSEQRGSADAP